MPERGLVERSVAEVVAEATARRKEVRAGRDAAWREGMELRVKRLEEQQAELRSRLNLVFMGVVTGVIVQIVLHALGRLGV